MGWDIILALIIFLALASTAIYRYKVATERFSEKFSTNYKKLQRKSLGLTEETQAKELLEGALAKDKTEESKLLEKKLFCAGWSITPGAFRLLEASISLVCITFSYAFLTLPFVIFSIFAGPLICRLILDFVVEHKVKRFEKDFGQFLMSLLSLLKTGMTPIQAMEAVANTLDDESLVKAETMEMLEALRNGVNEERAISRFGERILSPSIEAFIQVLLVGKRFGGSLADSLERLATIVRKRIQFKLEAKAAVGQAKLSLLIIVAVLSLAMLVLALTFPGFKEAFNDGLGRSVLHFVIVCVLCSLVLIRKITNIKL